VGGTCGGTLVGTTYTTNSITAACTVQARFYADTCAIPPAYPSVRNTAVPTQTGTVEYTYSVIPSAMTHDLVVGLADEPVTHWDNMATRVRFRNTGIVDAAGAASASYSALNVFEYTAHTVYNVRVVLDLAAQTYDVYVAADGESETTIALDNPVQSTQSGISEINTVGEISGAYQDAYGPLVCLGALEGVADLSLFGFLPAAGARLTQSVGSVSVELETNKAATCAWGYRPGIAWGSLTQYSATGGTEHSYTLPVLNGGVYQICTRCLDTAEQTYSADSCVSWSVAADHQEAPW
jgi:hypothetical protein